MSEVSIEFKIRKA